MPAPWFASTVDGMIPRSGAAVGNLLPGTGSTAQRSASTLNTQSASSPVLPLRTSGSAGITFAMSNVSDASGPSITFVNGSAVNRFRLQRTAAGNTLTFQYWNGSAWVAIGATFAILANTAYIARFEWSGYGTSSGAFSLRVFTDGAEAEVAVRSVTGINLTAQDGVAQMVLTSAIASQNMSYASAFVCDNNGDTSYVYNNVANANGSDTDGTGDFNSVNSTGSNYDTTFISLPASGNRRSVRNSAARNYAGRSVRAVSVNVRLRRGATGPTQARVYLTIGGTRYYHPTTLTLTTAFVSYPMVWETDPSTSSPWTLTNAQAASLEWGVEAV